MNDETTLQPAIPEPRIVYKRSGPSPNAPNWVTFNVRTEDAELAERALAAQEAQPAPEAIAWLYQARKPGSRSEYASVCDNDSRHWPFDGNGWVEETRTPLGIIGPAVVTWPKDRAGEAGEPVAQPEPHEHFSLQRLIAWLESKYGRHGELEDKYAAEALSRLAAMQETQRSSHASETDEQKGVGEPVAQQEPDKAALDAEYERGRRAGITQVYDALAAKEGAQQEPAPFGDESKTLLNARTMGEAKAALKGEPLSDARIAELWSWANSREGEDSGATTGQHAFARAIEREVRAALKPTAGTTDAARLDWLEAHPREGSIRLEDGTFAMAKFWAISADARWTIREAIDAALTRSTGAQK